MRPRPTSPASPLHLPAALWLVAGALGCDGETAPDKAETPYEGDVAGECTDGADNDRDGWFDCDDNGCWNAPECADRDGADADTDADTDADADTDTDADADADTDADTDTPWAAYRTVEVGFSIGFDFDDAYEAILESYGLWDCTAHYAGSGTVDAPAALSVTFQGPWALTGHDCGGGLEDTVWTDASGEAWHTVHFSDGGGAEPVAEAWLVHRDRADTEPVAEPSSNGQFYVTELSTPVSGGSVVWSDTETTVVDGLIGLELSYDLELELGD